MEKIYSVLTITESQDYTPSVTIIAHFTSFDKADDCLERTFKDAVDDYTDTYGKDSISIDNERYIVESLNYHDSIRCEIQESILDDEE